jgi:hypothetical protein
VKNDKQDDLQYWKTELQQVKRTWIQTLFDRSKIPAFSFSKNPRNSYVYVRNTRPLPDTKYKGQDPKNITQEEISHGLSLNSDTKDNDHNITQNELLNELSLNKSTKVQHAQQRQSSRKTNSFVYVKKIKPTSLSAMNDFNLLVLPLPKEEKKDLKPCHSKDERNEHIQAIPTLTVKTNISSHQEINCHDEVSEKNDDIPSTPTPIEKSNDYNYNLSISPTAKNHPIVPIKYHWLKIKNENYFPPNEQTRSYFKYPHPDDLDKDPESYQTWISEISGYDDIEEYKAWYQSVHETFPENNEGYIPLGDDFIYNPPLPLDEYPHPDIIDKVLQKSCINISMFPPNDEEIQEFIDTFGEDPTWTDTDEIIQNQFSSFVYHVLSLHPGDFSNENVKYRIWYETVRPKPPKIDQVMSWYGFDSFTKWKESNAHILPDTKSHLKI